MANPESTVQQWEAVAEIVMKRDFKADGSTREAAPSGFSSLGGIEFYETENYTANGRF